jgi:hypothetical protein
MRYRKAVTYLPIAPSKRRYDEAAFRWNRCP